MMEMTEILKQCVESGASDLHLAVGCPPMLRVNGSLDSLDAPVLSPSDVSHLI
jgi:twitching motility protein PilT